MFHFLEESEHNLKFFCQDALGNKGPVDEEKFKVEGRPFNIFLFKKWNLISVPFVLLNSDIEVVFNDTKQNITSVWTYENNTWFVWTPGPAPDTLHNILPGVGYWVLANNDTDIKIGGSLFSPITTPPSRDLVSGWNLIGPYGTDWQNFSSDPLCAYKTAAPDGIFADFAYCSLNSLVDTQQGLPRWSSLWTFVNCPGELVPWKGINACTDKPDENKMVVGYGYWIEVDVPDIYAPSSVCKQSNNCVYFTPS